MLQLLRAIGWGSAACVALACSSTDAPVGPSGASGGTSLGGSAPSGGASGSGGTAGGGAGTAGGGAGTAGGGAGTAGGGGGAGMAGGGANSGGAPGGGGGGAGENAVEPTFATVKRVVQASCFGAPCHDEPGNPLQLKPLDDLITKLKGHTTQDCGPALTPGSPQDSAFLELLKNTCGGTARMPLGKCFDDGDPGCVPPEDISAIEKWIRDGAKP